MPPSLTRQQAREVDRIAAEEFGISGLVLMENAGRNAAQIIADTYFTDPHQLKSVAIFCGPGNNGGDGFVIARHLSNAAVNVRIGLAGDKDKLSPDAAANHRICKAMTLPIAPANDVEIKPDDVVIDALLGTGFSGEVRDSLKNVIDRINRSPHRAVVAIDVPSGLDCDTGQPSNATIQAELTITFVADKIGFQRDTARPFVGQVVVTDIGAPPAVIDRVLADSSKHP